MVTRAIPEIWISGSILKKNNAHKVVTVLEELGFGELDLTAADFIKPGNVIQLATLHYELTC
jgi:hypothetical protein